MVLFDTPCKCSYYFIIYYFVLLAGFLCKHKVKEKLFSLAFKLVNFGMNGPLQQFRKNNEVELVLTKAFSTA